MRKFRLTDTDVWVPTIFSNVMEPLTEFLWCFLFFVAFSMLWLLQIAFVPLIILMLPAYFLVENCKLFRNKFTAYCVVYISGVLPLPAIIADKLVERVY